MDAELTAYRKERKRVVLMTDNEERGTKRARKQELQRRRLVTACIEVNAAVADTAAFEAVIAGHKQMQFERECKEQAVAERGALFERTAKALHLSIKEMKKEVLREKLQGMRPEGMCPILHWQHKTRLYQEILPSQKWHITRC